MRVLYSIVLVLSLVSCSTSLKPQKRDYKIPDISVDGSYNISSKNKKSKNFVFIIADNFDSIAWYESPLAKMMSQKKYRVVIPNVPGRNATERKAVDHRNLRIKSIMFIYYDLLLKGEVDSTSKITIIGFGEGAYLVPYLVNHMDYVNEFVMVNAALGSFISELQLLVSEGNPKIFENKKMRYMYIDNLDKLRLSIRDLLVNPYNGLSLGNRTNRDWMSYYDNPVEIELSLINQRGYVLISKDFPLLSSTSVKQLELIISSNPLTDVQIIKIEGKGNFSKENEILLLTKKLKMLIN